MELHTESVKKGYTVTHKVGWHTEELQYPVFSS